MVSNWVHAFDIRLVAFQMNEKKGEDNDRDHCYFFLFLLVYFLWHSINDLTNFYCFDCIRLEYIKRNSNGSNAVYKYVLGWSYEVHRCMRAAEIIHFELIV